MIKEIPILYSTMMAKAKVEMKKTQTRRSHGLEEININPGHWQFVGELVPNHKQKPQPVFRFMHNESRRLVDIQCPYGQPGDLLWGRESVNKGQNGKFHYKADELGPLDDVKWTPSIHMPKIAARIWDEVISVRVERVADISESDAQAEGAEPADCCGAYFHGFSKVWQKINGKPKATKTGYIVYPFDAEAGKEFEGVTTWKGKPLKVVINPWVWVIETKQLSVTGKPSSETDAVHRY